MSMSNRDLSLSADFLALVQNLIIAATLGFGAIALHYSAGLDHHPNIKYAAQLACIVIGLACLFAATLNFADARTRTIPSKGKAAVAWAIWWASVLSLSATGWALAVGFADYEARNARHPVSVAIARQDINPCTSLPCSTNN